MALTQAAKEKIIQLKKRNEMSEQIKEQKETFSDSVNPILRMYPIPEFKNKLLYYKIDLMMFEDDITLKVAIRTEDTVSHNFMTEENMYSGSKGFMNMKGDIQFENTHNYPSNVIASEMSPHPFYEDMKAKRKDFIKRYKEKSMVIQPYMCNFHLSGEKKEGTYDFSNAIVALEQNCDPEVYIRIADWEFHQNIPLYSEKVVRKKACWIYTVKEKIRDFNPKRRSLF